MLIKLLKVIIFTRVSKKVFLIFLVASLFYLSISITLLLRGVRPILSPNLTVIYVTLFYILFSYISSFNILKADIDYLFTSPIDRKELGIALYISALLINLIYIVNFMLFSYNIELLLISPLLGISVVSLRFLTQDVRYNLVILSVIALWLLSPLFGFEYSPTAAAFGYFYDSLFVTIPYATLLTLLSLMRLRNIDQILMRRSTTPVDEYRISFNTRNPFIAFLKFKLTYFSTAYTTTEGNVKVIRMNQVIGASSIMGVIYFVIFKYLVSNEIFYPSLSIAIVFIILYSTIMVVMNNIAHDRLWLTVLSVGNKAFKYLVITSGIRSLIMNLPLGIVNFVLSTWHPVFLNIGIAMLTYVPLISMLYTYLSAISNPFQLRDVLNPINVEIRGNRLLSNITFIILLLSALILSFIPIILIVVLTLVMSLVLLFLLRDKMIVEVINRMSEAGYT